MARCVLIAALAAAMLAVVPAHAQESEPLLDGAPPPLQVPKPAAPRPATPKPPAPKPATPDPGLKAEQARLARQAEAQEAERRRLAALSADLDARKASLAAQKASLDARERDIADEEARLARVSADQDADYARKLAELDAKPPPAPRALAPAPPVRVSYDDARRACTRAGMSEAVDNDFYSARYDGAPRYFERQRELRGRMRMDDGDGYLTVDTVCQLDANGAVLRFEVLR